MKKIIFCLFALVLLAPETLLATNVGGYVYDTNDLPLVEVNVSTSDAYQIHTSYTDFYGYYSLWPLNNQKYTLKYEKHGYETQTKDIDLTSGENYILVERVTLIKLPSTPTPTPTPTPTQINIAGTWKGNLTIPELGSDSVTAYLSQNGNDITGNTNDENGCEGTITGTIAGSILDFTVNGKKSKNCCKTTYKGTAIITCEEDHMVMTFTLKLKGNCSGKTVGSGEFWKQ